MSAVFDASVIVKWFVDDPLADAAIQARRTYASTVAPDLMLIEVANVFRRYVVRGELQSSSAAVAHVSTCGSTSPLHNGQCPPHPAPDFVARTSAPHTITSRL